MLSPLAMAGTAALAGGIGILSMAWVVLAALSADGARGRAWALLAATVALATAPLALRRTAAAPGDGAVFLGATLLLVAAAICLWRLRGVAGAGWAARVGIGACLILWATLWVLWSDNL
jgi:hypothetical protein